jgi:peptide/nickel transport system permease protein
MLGPVSIRAFTTRMTRRFFKARLTALSGSFRSLKIRARVGQVWTHAGSSFRLMRWLHDALLAFPGILFALGLLAVIGANKYGIILVLSIAYTPSVVRVVRGTVLSLRELEFVEASRVMGNSEIYTMLRHVLPNCIGPLTVLSTSMFGLVLLSESALSFLGLGVPPPAPTWRNMLAASRQIIGRAPWLAVFPGMMISVSLFGINLAGDAVRDWMDHRMKS